MADDNAEHAALFLPLPGASCLYKFNRPDYYFQCLLLGLEWHRAEQVFRSVLQVRLVAHCGRPPLASGACRWPLAPATGAALSRRPGGCIPVWKTERLWYLPTVLLLALQAVL